jgi:hypothetical protein
MLRYAVIMLLVIFCLLQQALIVRYDALITENLRIIDECLGITKGR